MYVTLSAYWDSFFVAELEKNENEKIKSILTENNKISLEEATDMLEKFLGPLVKAICEEKSFSLNWCCDALCWK